MLGANDGAVLGLPLGAQLGLVDGAVHDGKSILMTNVFDTLSRDNTLNSISDTVGSSFIAKYPVNPNSPSLNIALFPSYSSKILHTLVSRKELFAQLGFVISMEKTPCSKSWTFAQTSSPSAVENSTK